MEPRNKKGRGTGRIIFSILNVLSDVAMTPPIMIGAMLDAGYGASYGKLSRAADRIKDDIDRSKVARRERRREYQRYSMMVRYLKQNGMLLEKRAEDGVKLYLTRKGREKLVNMRKEQRDDKLGFAYKKLPGKKIVIVTYDIPEKRRKERDWLRAVVKRIGLEPMQQSVWIGKVVIPAQLIEELALRQLTSYVEIVEVGSTGTFRYLA